MPAFQEEMEDSDSSYVSYDEDDEVSFRNNYSAVIKLARFILAPGGIGYRFTETRPERDLQKVRRAGE